jgi:16S rRNA U1498 N3-methylase RsmE
VTCTITSVDARGAVEVERSGETVSVAWAGAAWHAAVACSSLGSRADWVVEKCAELGVHTCVGSRAQAAG